MLIRKKKKKKNNDILSFYVNAISQHETHRYIPQHYGGECTSLNRRNMYDHKEEKEEESQWNPVIFVCYFLAWNPQTKKPHHYGGE